MVTMFGFWNKSNIALLQELYRTMAQFTKDIKQKIGIEERKQQAKEHRSQTDFLEECKKSIHINKK